MYVCLCVHACAHAHVPTSNPVNDSRVCVFDRFTFTKLYMNKYVYWCIFMPLIFVQVFHVFIFNYVVKRFVLFKTLYKLSVIIIRCGSSKTNVERKCVKVCYMPVLFAMERQCICTICVICRAAEIHSWLTHCPVTQSHLQFHITAILTWLELQKCGAAWKGMVS